MDKKKFCSDYTYELVKSVVSEIWTHLYNLRQTKKAENGERTLTQPEREDLVSQIFVQVGPSVSKVKKEIPDDSRCSKLLGLMVVDVKDNIVDKDELERVQLKDLIIRLFNDTDGKAILLGLQDKIEGKKLNWSGGRRSSKKHHCRKSAKRSRRKSAKRSRRSSRK